MIDKLKLVTNCKVDWQALQQPSFKLDFPLDKHYKQCFSFSRNGRHVVTIKHVPRHSNMALNVIEINPSHFKTFQSLINFICRFTNPYGLLVKRIDFAVDLNMPIEDIYQTLHIPKKVKRSDFAQGDRLTGFDIGRQPEEVCVYDKAFERVSAKKYRKRKVSGEMKEQTRVEVRHFRQKVKYKLFLDLPHYLKVDPFQKIRFLKLKDSIKKSSRLDPLKLYRHSKDHGLQALCKTLNRSSNLSKYKDQYFTETGSSQKLLEEYTLNLQKYFEIPSDTIEEEIYWLTLETLGERNKILVQTTNTNKSKQEVTTACEQLY